MIANMTDALNHIKWLEDRIEALVAEKDKTLTRVAELEAAIRTHQQNHPDEPLATDRALWQIVLRDKRYCSYSECGRRRKHHEEPHEYRDHQLVDVPSDLPANTPVYCSIECQKYGTKR